MDANEVRRRRDEAESRLKSDLRAAERSLGEYCQYMRELREGCPHENVRSDAAQYVLQTVCEDCGKVLLAMVS